ncbi:MAG: hypothetical protein OES38_18885, partial [Gammaproteobacteria bacterium]|nr:hypothetical protein [Gammaproteobacteria bacterium]
MNKALRTHESAFFRTTSAMLFVALFAIGDAYADRDHDHDGSDHRADHHENHGHGNGGRRAGNPYPRPNDPSAFTPLSTEDLPVDLPPANEGALEGGETGSVADTTRDNSIPEDELRTGFGFDIPTNGAPSPLFGAQPFTQKMLRFEEFGPQRLNVNKKSRGRPPHWSPFPAPDDAQRGPDGAELEHFLAQGIFPTPTKLANVRHSNPWQPEIE